MHVCALSNAVQGANPHHSAGDFSVLSAVPWECFGLRCKSAIAIGSEGEGLRVWFACLRQCASACGYTHSARKLCGDSSVVL
jgi:hypothetical protein